MVIFIEFWLCWSKLSCSSEGAVLTAWIIYNDFGQNCDFDNLGNDQIQNEEMAYWSSIVGQAVASGIITPDFKSALGEKVCLIVSVRL